MRKTTILTSLCILICGNLSLGGVPKIESSTFPKQQKVLDTEDYKSHAAVLMGSSSPEGSHHAGGEVGVDLGFQPYIPFGVGLEVTKTRNTSGQFGDEDLNRTNLLMKANYNFGGDTILKYSYVGLMAGVSKSNDDILLVSAPQIGADVPLSSLNQSWEKNLSVGATARYLVYEGSSPDSMSLNGVMKYWF